MANYLLLYLSSQRLLFSSRHHIVQELVDRLMVVPEKTPVKEAGNLCLTRKVAHLGEDMVVLVLEIRVVHGVLLNGNRLVPLLDLGKVERRQLVRLLQLLLHPLLSLQQDFWVV